MRGFAAKLNSFKHLTYLHQIKSNHQKMMSRLTYKILYKLSTKHSYINTDHNIIHFYHKITCTTKPVMVAKYTHFQIFSIHPARCDKSLPPPLVVFSVVGAWGHGLWNAFLLSREDRDKVAPSAHYYSPSLSNPWHRPSAARPRSCQSPSKKRITISRYMLTTTQRNVFLIYCQCLKGTASHLV